MGKVVTKTKDRKPRLNSLGAVCRPRGNHVAHDRTECNLTTTQIVIGLKLYFILPFPILRKPTGSLKYPPLLLLCGEYALQPRGLTIYGVGRKRSDFIGIKSSQVTKYGLSLNRKGSYTEQYR